MFFSNLKLGSWGVYSCVRLLETVTNKSNSAINTYLFGIKIFVLPKDFLVSLCFIKALFSVVSFFPYRFFTAHCLFSIIRAFVAISCLLRHYHGFLRICGRYFN